MPPPKYLTTKTVPTLRKHARDNGVAVGSRARKDELVAAIAKHESRSLLNPAHVKKMVAHVPDKNLRSAAQTAGAPVPDDATRDDVIEAIVGGGWLKDTITSCAGFSCNNTNAVKVVKPVKVFEPRHKASNEVSINDNNLEIGIQLEVLKQFLPDFIGIDLAGLSVEEERTRREPIVEVTNRASETIQTILQKYGAPQCKAYEAQSTNWDIVIEYYTDIKEKKYIRGFKLPQWYDTILKCKQQYERELAEAVQEIEYLERPFTDPHIAAIEGVVEKDIDDWVERYKKNSTSQNARRSGGRKTP